MNVKSLSVVAAALMSAAAGAGEKEFDSVRIVLKDGTAADKVEFAFDPFGLVLVEFSFGK